MNIWNTALEMAAQTPPERNRYVDFLRAISIMVVVTGHWLIAGFLVTGEDIHSVQVLAAIPETQWLTWLFQVMPIFFIVGGYSNAVSLESAQRRNVGYAEWLSSRLDRLLRPLLPLIAFWTLLAIVLRLIDVAPENVQLLTQMALIPIWFLAIYTMVVVLAPLTYNAWRQYGLMSFAALTALAIIVDAAVFIADLKWAGWTNYFWIWLAVHQLGYAWRANRFSGSTRSLIVSVAAWVMLAVMVHFGPYPLAMVGSPDEDISNTLPPKLPLLVLGIAQFSLLLILESPLNRWLDNLRVWAATVLVNSMIMTLYLWHITIMLLFVYVLWQVGGIGLGLDPGTETWWLTRPIWVLLLFAVLLPFTLALSPVERSARPPARQTPGILLVSGAIMICSGIALMAMFGLGNSTVPLMDACAVALIGVGAVVSGVIGLPRFST